MPVCGVHLDGLAGDELDFECILIIFFLQAQDMSYHALFRLRKCREIIGGLERQERCEEREKCGNGEVLHAVRIRCYPAPQVKQGHAPTLFTRMPLCRQPTSRKFAFRPAIQTK